MSPKTRPWTRDEYYRLGEAGVFAPDERVELIEGDILPVSPQNKPHALAIMRGTTTLVRTFGQTHHVRVQLPLDLGASQPEPDFALVPHGAAEAAPLHPTSADLVIEVSLSSLGFDRAEKASVYAKYGIPEYWVLDVASARLFVHLDPGPDTASPYGFTYRTWHVLTQDKTAVPSQPALGGQGVAVAGLL